MNRADRVDQAVAAAQVLLDCVKMAGENGIPSGHLYAMTMGVLSIGVYNQLIGALIAAGKVEEKYHVLRYTGK